MSREKLTITRRDRKAEEINQEKPHWQLRRTLAERLVGTSDRSLIERVVLEGQHRRAAMRAIDYAFSELDEGRDVEAHVCGRGKIECTRFDFKGQDKLGLFSAGASVRVRGEAFGHATVRFDVKADDITGFDPDSLVVARWDELTKRLRVLPASGFDATSGRAYARISRPGIYTVVGIPRDPRVRKTLEIMSVLRDWGDLGEKVGLNKRICQLILCNPDMQQIVDRSLTGEPVPEFGMFGIDPRFERGNLCEVCVAGGFGIGHDIFDIPRRPPPFLKPRCPSWTSIGPSNVPGRVNALAIHPTNGQYVFAGAAAGGVFRSRDAGAHWSPLWSEQLSLAIGGLAVAPSNPDVLYAATGEWEGNVGAANNHFAGVGVYKSIDGGVDWDLLGPISSQNTTAVAIDPGDPDRVFVAGDRGLHRSTDGGRTWPIPAGRVNGVFDGVITDVKIDPANTNRLYMGVHNDGIYRSLDGGNTWARLTNGIATGGDANAPKLGLGVNGANGSQFVAVKMALRVFTSTDGGTTFTEQANCGAAWGNFYPWANVIAVDPTDEAVLIGGHNNLYRSTDGGATWTQVAGYGTNVHADQQAVVFDPNNHDHMFLATDGGIYESTDNGATWTARSTGLVTAQCWTVGVAQGSQLAYGNTTQDNACYEWSGGQAFQEILGPEGGWIEYDPNDAQIIFGDTWFASAQRSDDGGTTWTSLGVDTDAGHSEMLSISRADGTRLLAIAGGIVQRSTDRGASWTQVLAPAGVRLSALQFAPSNDQHAYAASDRGRVWHSTDGGATWNELARVSLPFARVHDIEVDPHDPRRLYLAFGAIGVRQLWRGDLDTAGNATWFDVSGAQRAVSLPDLALTGLALDTRFEETIYVSNILGVYRSIDGGESWAPFDDGLPNCWVSDLDYRERDNALYVSTMGRGLYRRYV
jgi:photosystem II stability/assembly factor-like uncharacterized protein